MTETTWIHRIVPSAVMKSWLITNHGLLSDLEPGGAGGQIQGAVVGIFPRFPKLHIITAMAGTARIIIILAFSYTLLSPGLHLCNLSHAVLETRTGITVFQRCAFFHIKWKRAQFDWLLDPLSV